MKKQKFKCQGLEVLQLMFMVVVMVISAIPLFFTNVYADEIIEFKSPVVDIESLEFESEAQIPGTDIKMGALNVNSARKIAFESGNKFYYLEFLKMYKSRGTEKIGLPVYKDIDHGIFKNFLIIRGFEGATGHNAWLFLFRVDKNQIRLVDVLHSKYINHLEFDFFLNLQEEGKLSGIKRGDKYDRDYHRIIFYPLNDRDGDGNPEIKLSFVGLNFDLFVESSENGLKVDLNPKLYEQPFNLLKKKAKKNKQDFCNYIIYGFITEAFDKDEIKKKLAGMKENEAKKIMNIIDNLNKLNDALHPKEQIILKKIEKGGRHDEKKNQLPNKFQTSPYNFGYSYVSCGLGL